jgi:hypothetical protein
MSEFTESCEWCAKTKNEQVLPQLPIHSLIGSICFTYTSEEHFWGAMLIRCWSSIVLAHESLRTEQSALLPNTCALCCTVHYFGISHSRGTQSCTPGAPPYASLTKSLFDRFGGLCPCWGGVFLGVRVRRLCEFLSLFTRFLPISP